MRTWQRIVLGSLMLGAVAIAGIALNFALLGLTQDAHDPVGKLSPRAVFTGRSAPPATGSVTTTTAGSDDGSSEGFDRPPESGDGDD